MPDNIREDAKKVYEIGYLLISSIPKEKVPQVAADLREVLSKKKAEILGEDAPELIQLAYTMIKKIGTANHRFDEAYFGWVKFELAQRDIEDAKKSFETHPEMLRCLVITAVRDNTYLGKKAPALQPVAAPEIAAEASAEAQGTGPAADEKAASASREDMDKSIDEMVKEA